MLVSNWRAVIRHAWSVRLIILAGLFSGLEVAVPYLDGYLLIPRGLFAGLAGMITFGALVARMIAQANVSGAQNAGNQN